MLYIQLTSAPAGRPRAQDVIHGVFEVFRSPPAARSLPPSTHNERANYLITFQTAIPIIYSPTVLYTAGDVYQMLTQLDRRTV